MIIGGCWREWTEGWHRRKGTLLLSWEENVCLTHARAHNQLMKAKICSKEKCILSWGFFKGDWFAWVHFYEQQKNFHYSVQLSIRFLTWYSSSSSTEYIIMFLASTPLCWNFHHTEALVTTCQLELLCWITAMFSDTPFNFSPSVFPSKRGTKPIWDKNYDIVIGNFPPKLAAGKSRVDDKHSLNLYSEWHQQ